MAIIVFWLILILIPALVKNKTAKIWLTVLLAIWLVLVMISRVYLYAHWPSDVCGSVAMGLMWISLVDAIWDKVTPQTDKNNF
jgi:membrane-associated phospholipid phosphatase